MRSQATQAPQFETLGKYHVLERLAASRLAEIYKVKTVGIAGFEKVQVLNRILPRYARDATFLRAFIAEAKIAFSLNHRNIVQVFEFGKMDGELFLATEYIPGVNLEEVLHRCRGGDAQVPVGLACYLMGEVAAGLEYAHRKTDQGGQPLHIAHGDLSPYNVGCSWEGSVKVLDFGICRAADRGAAREDRYRGLPRYLAPERFRGEGLSAASDVFSFGVVLWELLTGEPLVRGRDAGEVEARILEGQPPGPRERNREVPVELDALTLRCLASDPADRIGSANELQIELHRIQRQVGAVIGSRALSTFLHELFPTHAETRDVRQQGTAEAAQEAPRDRQRQAEPIDALVAAAAELAQPQNPPAEAVRERRRRRRPTREARRDEGLGRRASQEARVAGVLRSTRHLDEDLTVGPPKRRRRRERDRSLASLASDEVTAGPVETSGDSPRAAAPLPTAQAPPRRTEEFSHDDLERVIAADDGAARPQTPNRSPRDPRRLGREPVAPRREDATLDISRGHLDHEAERALAPSPAGGRTQTAVDADVDAALLDPRQREALESAPAGDTSDDDDLESATFDRSAHLEPHGRDGTIESHATVESDPSVESHGSLEPHGTVEPRATVEARTLSDEDFGSAGELDPSVDELSVDSLGLDDLAVEDPRLESTSSSHDEAELDAAVAMLSSDDPWERLGGRPPVVADDDDGLGETEIDDELLDGLDLETTDSLRSPPAHSNPGEAMAASTVAPAAAPGAPPAADKGLQSPPTSAALLGEKKRFIAVAVIVEGPSEACAEALRLVADIAFKLEGLIHRRDQRHLVALFGLPMNDENDIVSAVRFGRDALEAVAHLTPRREQGGPRSEESVAQWEQGVGLRAGIRVGTARMGGATSRDGFQLLGNAVDETSALAEHSAEGQLAIAGSAARLASMHYVLRQVEALRRHGKPIRCYRVLGPQPAEQRRRDSGVPLIGREIELNALRSAWRETALDGIQRTAQIIGDPGLGKSRLVDEFLLRHGGDARVLSIAATPHRREMPHALVLDLFRVATGVSGTASPRSRTRLLERLEQLLGAMELDQREDILDTVEALLDPAAAPLGESAEARRSRVAAAARALLSELSRQRPLVTVIEDLHWADSSSFETFAALFLSPDEAAGPLFLLTTMRPGESSEADDLLGEGIVSQVILEELDPGDRQQLIIECLGDRAGDENLAGEIEHRAGGNPFYIHELAQAAQELDLSAFAAIPDSVRGVLASRVDRLPSQAKVVLQHAAVIGPVFREGILTRLLARNPARSLAELRNRGILVPGVNMAVPYTTGTSEQFEREWAFRHVLVQQVVYEALASGDRRELHAKVGEIMRSRSARGSSDPPAEVARHLQLAGEREEAGEYYLRAAEAALAGYANKEAAQLFDRAIELTQSDDEGGAERLYRAHAGRERVLGRLGLHERQAQDLSTLRQIGDQDASQRADLRAREALRLLRVGEIYRALEAAEQAEEAAREAGDALLEGEALRLRGEAYERLDDHDRALTAAQQALAIFEAQEAIPHQVRARISLGRVLLAQARYDDALDHYVPAYELIEETDDRWHERVLRNNTAVVHLCRGDLPRALEDAMYSLKLCVEFGDLAREGDNATVIGIVYLELGQLEQAQHYLDEALAIHGETGSRWSEADTLTYLGALANARGEATAALAHLERARSLAQQLGARYIEINALVGLARVLCDRDQGDDAQRALTLAREGFERAGTLGLIVGEIPGLSLAARAHALLGDHESARALSRRAVELLEAQQHIDGSEQEIFYTHYRILRDSDAPGDEAALDQARESVEAKLGELSDTDQRRSFCTRVRLNAAILADSEA